MLNKRGRLTLSIIVGITFFLVFKDTVIGAKGNIILLGCSAVYFLATLRATGNKEYSALFANFGVLTFITLFTVLNIMDNNLLMSFGEAFSNGTFIVFVLIGTPLMFISMFLMGNKRRKSNKRLVN